MSNFEWYTDEDGNWEDLTPTSPPLQPAERQQTVRLAVLVLVVLAGLAIYQHLNQRVAEVGAFISEELLSSHKLRLRAVAAHDREIFDSVLSGSNTSWMQAQQNLFEQNLTLDRWPLGLSVAAADSHLLTISPAPDLKAAEVTVTQAYTVQQPDGAQSMVTLQHTDVYRRGQQRWLYAPPSQEFWGNWQTADGRYLTLIYPYRDHTIAQQLLADFDTAITTYCAQPQAHCPPDLHLLVRFDTHPQSLLDLSNLAALWQSNSVLELPTPSLVGLPTDDAGYQALRRGYSSQLMATTIQKNMRWPCCTQGLFHQALIDKQLSQMGLKSWPLTDEVYGSIFQNPIAGIDELQRFWYEPPIVPLTGTAWPQVYSLVDFVLSHEPDIALPTLQRQLLRTDSYDNWLDSSLSMAPDSVSWQPQWLHFAQSHLPTATAVPLPEQDILLLCNATTQDSRETSLFRYNPHSDRLTTDLAQRHFLFMTPLPHDKGVLLHERRTQENRTQIILWQNGQETAAGHQSLSSGLFHVEPTGNALTLYSYDFAENESQLNLLNVAACNDHGCPSQQLAGTPYWSLDNRHALLVTDKEHLWLADANGRILHDIGIGIAPFWLDETHYGYAHVAGNLNRAPAELMVTAVNDNHPQTWLPLAELASALPPSVRLSHLTIRSISAAPHQPHLLFIATNVRPRQSNLRSLLFAYHLQSKQIQLLHASAYTLGFYKPLTFSADGNWLTAATFAHTTTLSDLFLYHIPSGYSQTLGSNQTLSALDYDWSANSQWLLRLESGFLHLLEPISGAQKIYVHDLSGCRFAAWVNR